MSSPFWLKNGKTRIRMVLSRSLHDDDCSLIEFIIYFIYNLETNQLRKLYSCLNKFYNNVNRFVKRLNAQLKRRLWLILLQNK